MTFHDLLKDLAGEEIKLRWTTGMGELRAFVHELHDDFVALETDTRTLYAPLTSILNIERA